MTNRLKYPEYWAQDGSATDPDLDTTNPSYVADKYEKQGWISQKPPEEWQNFLSQISDVKIIDWMQDGILEYDASVSYVMGGVCSYSGEFYKLVAAQPSTPVIPTDATSGFTKILGKSSAEYQTLVDALKKLISDHLAANNPHKDAVNTLTDGGYIKTAIDDFFGSATDPKTIVYHKLQMGQTVHKETVAQLNTLPTSGGTFTGDVIFAADAILNVTPSKMFHFNKATALLELVNGTMALGIDSNGKCFVVNASGQSQVIPEALYNQTEIMYNGKFALPLPMISMNIESTISDAESIGTWWTTVTGIPQFTQTAGFKVSDNRFTLRSFYVGSPATALFLGATIRDGDPTITQVRVVNDIPAKDYSDKSIAELMSDIGALAASHIKQIVIYPRLTAYQKSMLVV